MIYQLGVTDEPLMAMSICGEVDRKPENKLREAFANLKAEIATPDVNAALDKRLEKACSEGDYEKHEVPKPAEASSVIVVHHSNVHLDAGAWIARVAANGQQPAYDLPCKVTPDDAFECQDKCGINAGWIEISDDRRSATLHFDRVCGKPTDRSPGYRMVEFSNSIMRLEGPFDWQIWTRG
jgi:hypothetical protein